MVEKALTYALKGSGKFRHVLGATLFYFSWLLYPAILLIGYYIQALTFASVGQEEPPPFGQILSLSKLGVVGSVIVFTYGGFFIAAPVIAISMVGSEFTSIQSMGELSLVLQLWIALIGVFALTMAVILPVVLCRYGRTTKIQTVYDIRGHIELIKTRQVFSAIIGTVLLTAGVVLGTTIFIFITLGIGIFLIPFILFWYGMTTAYLYGTAIGEVTGTVNTIKYSDIVDEINNGDEQSGTSNQNDGGSRS